MKCKEHLYTLVVFWKKNSPTSLPITVGVEWGTFRGGNKNQLSKIEIRSKEAFGRDNPEEIVLTTRVKWVLLQEYIVESKRVFNNEC